MHIGIRYCTYRGHKLPEEDAEIEEVDLFISDTVTRAAGETPLCVCVWGGGGVTCCSCCCLSPYCKLWSRSSTNIAAIILINTHVY